MIPTWLRELAEWILGLDRRIVWRLGLPTTIPSANTVQIVSRIFTSLEPITMAFQMTDVQQVPLSVGETDAKGNPVTPGKPVWGTSDPTILVIVEEPVGSGAFFAQAAGKLGTAQVNFTDGTLTAAASVTIVSSAATAANISFGTAGPIPPGP